MEARPGGEASPRVTAARLEDVSISGVRSRAGAGGMNGENA